MSHTNLDRTEEHHHSSGTAAVQDNTQSHSGLPQQGPFGHTLQSHGSIAHDLSGKLKARRSAASYDYLAGEGDDQRQGDATGKFSYHTGKKPSGRRSFDYLDEDQNRAPPAAAPVALNDSMGDRPGATSYFESDSDDEEAFLDHQIRMLKAKQAKAAAHKWANPGPIGLLAFGMTTICLNLHNTGVFGLYSVIPAMGICFGGGAQLIAGLLEWVRGNTFAYVAFVSYGAFWLSLVCVWMLPNVTTGDSPLVAAGDEYFVGLYLALWGVFSFFMMICTLRMNVAIFLVFLTVTLLFLLLGGGNMTNNATALRAAGYEGIVCGCLAMYLGVAEVVNEVWDRVILPVVPMTQVLEWFGANKAAKEKKEEEEVANAQPKETKQD
ncbi:hypothetical protein ABB37_09747 [Leptomonas pyrrhocoris]|uniref:Uncharacterized protein n=1 Tax=Leptomonas pyrrhocoris TaxID=157538 RepID=A0A0M9FPT8_LEPPY|nr:hypothetical protein ABB37_09747 [Leptomonas pyrrhocoris]KPA73615.1 hypothetical protein ABB37_09747 [Leptomonas pyrrhocoris]|eukprot:XP_015652054.1 hypothetical protein ABB37_09747 [Leptomonas pyrrhocoris]